MIVFLLPLRIGCGPAGLDECGQLVRGQAHTAHNADDVRVFQFQALRFQLFLPRLQLGDLRRVFLIFSVDLLNFGVYFVVLLFNYGVGSLANVKK